LEYWKNEKKEGRWSTAHGTRDTEEKEEPEEWNNGKMRRKNTRRQKEELEEWKFGKKRRGKQRAASGWFRAKAGER
jgi:hypothetical protein